MHDKIPSPRALLEPKICLLSNRLSQKSTVLHSHYCTALQIAILTPMPCTLGHRGLGHAPATSSTSSLMTQVSATLTLDFPTSLLLSINPLGCIYLARIHSPRQWPPLIFPPGHPHCTVGENQGLHPCLPSGQPLEAHKKGSRHYCPSRGKTVTFL